MKKEQLQADLAHQHRRRYLNNILANGIQQDVKHSTSYQVGFILGMQT